MQELLGEAARSLRCGGAGLEAAERVNRTGLLKLGEGMLEQLMAAHLGLRGPCVPCGNGHEVVFAGYRHKSFDTVLGLVAVTRAWYHCATCGHGLATRDAALGVAAASMSPGLAHFWLPQPFFEGGLEMIEISDECMIAALDGILSLGVDARLRLETQADWCRAAAARDRAVLDDQLLWRCHLRRLISGVAAMPGRT